MNTTPTGIISRRGFGLSRSLASRSVALLTLTGGLLACEVERQLTIGERVAFAVEDEGGTTALADVAGGVCRYVIITDPACAACRNAKQWWTDELGRGVVDLPDPKDWRIIWATFDEARSWAETVDERIAVVAFEDEQAALAALGITSVPAFIVLDRGGRLAASGTGARLPPHSSFRADCSVLPPVGAAIRELSP